MRIQVNQDESEEDDGNDDESEDNFEVGSASEDTEHIDVARKTMIMIMNVKKIGRVRRVDEDGNNKNSNMEMKMKKISNDLEKNQTRSPS